MVLVWFLSLVLCLHWQNCLYQYCCTVMQNIVHIIESSWFWGPLKVVFKWCLRDYSFIMTSEICIINSTVKTSWFLIGFKDELKYWQDHQVEFENG